MAINFNTSPYFDDFDPAKNFYKVLFKPGLAVQARELNQLQSILQNQVSSMGNHIFKKNSVVIPGGIAFHTAADIVSITEIDDPSVLVGRTITNATSFDPTDDSTLDGYITAVVLGYKKRTSLAEPHALYVKYFKAQTDGRSTFNLSEQLNTVGSSLITFRVDSTIGSTIGKVATLSAGTFYTKETFVDTPQQSIIVEVNRIVATTCTIGLNIIESIVTSDDDESLLDNANGSPNQYAPGADRYKITLELVRVDLTTTIDDEKFIRMMDIQNNVVTFINNKTQYAELMTTLARRTYDANGNFIVRGLDTTVTSSRDDNYIWANISGGKCYLGGYEYDQLATTPIAIEKPRSSAFQLQVNPVSTYHSGMTYMFVAGGIYTKEVPVENSLVQFINTSPFKAIFNGATGVDAGTDIITLPNHQLYSGNAVVYTNGGGASIGGLTSGNTYYAIRISSTEIKLASTLADALAGIPINFSAVGTGVAHAINKTFSVIGYGIYKHLEYALGSTNSTDVYKMFFDHVSLEKGYTFEDVGGIKACRCAVGAEGLPVLHQMNLTNLTGLFETGNLITSTTNVEQSGLMYYVINNFAYTIKHTTSRVPNVAIVRDNTTNATATLNSYFVTNFNEKSYPMILLDKDTIKTLYNDNGVNTTSYSIVRRDEFTVTTSGDQPSVILTGSDLFEEYSTSDYFAYITDTGYEQFVNLTGLIDVAGNVYTLSVPTGSPMIGRTVWVYSTVNKRLVTEAPKTKVVVTAGDVIPTPSSSWMALGKQDVVEITKIVDGKTLGVSTASWATNVASVTTTETHNLAVGNIVVITGVESSNNTSAAFNSGYNGKFTVVSVNAATNTFTYSLTVNPGTYVASDNDLVAVPPNINSDNDITNRYIFESGNTAYFSGTGLIKLKKGAVAPRGQIAVQYSQYAVGSGNYVSVDSYPHDEEDLTFIGKIADVIDSTGQAVQVRRYLDFRTRPSSYFFKNIATITNGSSSLTLRDLNLSYHATTLVGKYIVGPGFLNGAEITAVNFNPSTGNTVFTLASAATQSGTGMYYIGLNTTNLSVVDATAGGKYFQFPKDDTRLEYQYVKFLPKHIMVYIDREKDLLKVDYEEIREKMDAIKLRRNEFKLPLAYLYMEPYTLTVQSVELEKFENPVYQMLDIHTIKQRVDRTEYYSALALRGNVEDVPLAGGEGLTNASYGIWSETFDDIYQQDYNSDDYKCTIYSGNRVGPGTVVRVVPLEHDTTLNTSTWVRSGNTITLPYQEIRAFGNTAASRSANLNPYNAINWNGKLTLNPSVDNWVDVVSVPSTTVNSSKVRFQTTVNMDTTVNTAVNVNVTTTQAQIPTQISTPTVATQPAAIPAPLVNTQPAPVLPPLTPVVERVTEVRIINWGWGPDSRGTRRAATWEWRTSTGRTGRVNTDQYLAGATFPIEPNSGQNFNEGYIRTLALRGEEYNGVRHLLHAGQHFDQRPPSAWRR